MIPTIGHFLHYYAVARSIPTQGLLGMNSLIGTTDVVFTESDYIIGMRAK